MLGVLSLSSLRRFIDKMVLNSLVQWIHYLNDPIHVANIQAYFGVKRITNSDQTQKINAKQSSKAPRREVVSSGSSDESSESDREGTEYTISNHYWFWLFKFGTSLGEEIFYASMFPFWFWNIDGAVGRRVVIIWALSMFIGQCLKDIICWPRPACPPVVRMEKKWALEYGMPSTHAMVSFTVPMSVLFLTMSRYEYPVYIGLIIAVLWCILVSTSRLYLGMHSVADILGGLLLAACLLPVLIPLVDTLDPFLLTHPAAPGLVVTTSVTLILLYPGSKFSSAREDTAVILGSASGIQLGAWISYHLGTIRGPPVSPPYSVIWPSYEMLGLSLLRTVIGLITVVATRALAKSLAYAALRAGLAVQRRESGREGEDVELTVKLGAKLITYAAVGVDMMWFAPAVFRLLNIERPTFHTEI